jgi:hypothetical protein
MNRSNFHSQWGLPACQVEHGHRLGISAGNRGFGIAVGRAQVVAQTVWSNVPTLPTPRSFLR